MVKKTIKFDIYIKTSEQTPTYSYTAKQKVMSNDKDSTQITFNLLDVAPEELSGSSASILLYMEDGSFFQKSDVTINRNSVIYTMKPEETRHSGNTKVQIVLNKGTVQTASLIYNFEIERGLEKFPIVEKEIQDWTSLTAEAKAFVEQIKDFTLEGFVENKMGEELANLETNYATRLTGLEQKDNQLTAQLAQTIPKGQGAVGSDDLSQEVKEQMTGGSVAVVGKQMLLTENFVPKQITPSLTDFVLEKETDVVTSEVNVLTDFERRDGIFVNPIDGQDTPNAGYTTFTIPLSDEISIFHAFLNTAILGYSPASFYDKDNVFISGYQPVLNSQSEQVTYNSYSGIFYDKPVNAKMIKISVALSRLEPPNAILLMLTTQQTGTELSIPSLDLNTRVKSLEDGYSGGGVLTNKKIVNFGDSIFGNYRDTSEADKSISKMISERTGATVYNAGFGGCRMATHSNFWDAFSMHSLADSIATGNWAKQDQALIDGAGTLPSYFSETLTMIKNINFNEIDILTIGYGTNDYSGNIFIEHNPAFQDVDYFKGALRYSISTILSAKPHIKIVVISPMWRWFLPDGVYSYDSDDVELSKNTRDHILPDYVSACEEISRECHVLYLDNYYSLGINKYNYLEYFPPTDGTHPNLSGRELRANRIVGQLIANL